MSGPLPAPPPPPPTRTSTSAAAQRSLSPSPSTLPSSPPGPRNYASAIQHLNTLQTNHAILAAIRNSGRQMNNQAIPEMCAWVNRIGYPIATLTQKPNIIHVAGTKGKGSVCAFTSSILSQALKPLDLGIKIGLYTSPHLRSVRERIQIDGKPISKKLFARYFFEVWDRLEESARREGRDVGEKPVYFRYLTLMAFHVYISEKVEVVVLETGIGGEHDSTNVIHKPVATGISALAVDHVSVLGETVEQIAWHKAGIWKEGVKAFAVWNDKESVRKVVEERGREKAVLGGGEVGWVKDEIAGDVQLGLKGDFQRGNAALAVALAKETVRVLHTKDITPEIDTQALEKAVRKGLKEAVWPGRCQLFMDPLLPRLEWCLDGAHTPDSLPHAAKWYRELPAQHLPPSPTTTTTTTTTTTRPPNILLFNQQTRDPVPLLTALYTSLPATSTDDATLPYFTHIVFSTNVTFAESRGFKPDLVAAATRPQDLAELTVQQRLREVWLGLEAGRAEGKPVVVLCNTLQEAVEWVRGVVAGREGEGKGEGEVGGEVEREKAVGRVLVTGSLHLVGGVLEVLSQGVESSDEDA